MLTALRLLPSACIVLPSVIRCRARCRNFTGSTIITNMHADLTSDQTDIPMQGPFTEKFVGGRQHRHIELNQSRSSDDSLSMANNFNGLDTRADRPEGFRIQMGYEFTGSNTGSPWKASPGHLQVVSTTVPPSWILRVVPPIFSRGQRQIFREKNTPSVL